MSITNRIPENPGEIYPKAVPLYIHVAGESGLQMIVIGHAILTERVESSLFGSDTIELCIDDPDYNYLYDLKADNYVALTVAADNAIHHSAFITFNKRYNEAIGEN